MQSFQWEDPKCENIKKHFNITTLQQIESFSINLPKTTLTITINISDKITYNFKVLNKSGRVSRKTKPIQYKHMTISQQAQFIHTILERTVSCYFSGFAVYGVCKRGQLHVHCLCYGDYMSTEFELNQFKKQLHQNITINKLSKNPNLLLRLYYIAYNTMPMSESLAYLFKNQKEHDCKLPVLTFEK